MDHAGHSALHKAVVGCAPRAARYLMRNVGGDVNALTWCAYGDDSSKRAQRSPLLLAVLCKAAAEESGERTDVTEVLDDILKASALWTPTHRRMLAHTKARDGCGMPRGMVFHLAHV